MRILKRNSGDHAQYEFQDWLTTLEMAEIKDNYACGFDELPDDSQFVEIILMSLILDEAHQPRLIHR